MPTPSLKLPRSTSSTGADETWVRWAMRLTGACGADASEPSEAEQRVMRLELETRLAAAPPVAVMEFHFGDSTRAGDAATSGVGGPLGLVRVADLRVGAVVRESTLTTGEDRIAVLYDTDHAHYVKVRGAWRGSGESSWMRRQLYADLKGRVEVLAYIDPSGTVADRIARAKLVLDSAVSSSVASPPSPPPRSPPPPVAVGSRVRRDDIPVGAVVRETYPGGYRLSIRIGGGQMHYVYGGCSEQSTWRVVVPPGRSNPWPPDWDYSFIGEGVASSDTFEIVAVGVDVSGSGTERAQRVRDLLEPGAVFVGEMMPLERVPVGAVICDVAGDLVIRVDEMFGHYVWDKQADGPDGQQGWRRGGTRATPTAWRWGDTRAVSGRVEIVALGIDVRGDSMDRVRAAKAALGWKYTDVEG